MSAVPHPERVRVVLVDDTSDLRDLLRFALEQREFAVVAEAADGREGIEAVERTQPDLVLLDLAMPVMDGFEALPRMRATCPTAKIVVLSGFDAGVMASRAEDLGADGYLQKGSSLGRTVGYLREVLGTADPAPAALTLVSDHARPVATPRTPHAGVGASAPPDGDADADPDPATTSTARPEVDLGVVPAPRAFDPTPAWLQEVPVGIVEVGADDQLLHWANPAAERLLHRPGLAGSTLHACLPELDGLTGHDGSTVAVRRGGVPLTVTVTRTDGVLVLVVAPG